MRRDTLLAVDQLRKTIRRQLFVTPPLGLGPVRGLTDDHVSNLARHIAMMLDELGYTEDELVQAEACDA